MRKYKVILLSSFFSLFTVSAMADKEPFEQILTTESYYSGVIPKDVLYEQRDLFWNGQSISLKFEYSNKEYINSISLFDSKLDVVKQIPSKSPILLCRFIDAYRNGTKLPTTQNVFKNDDKYEYIMPNFDNEGNIKGITIIQDDGTALANIAFGQTEYLDEGDESCDGIPIDIIKIEDDWYLGLHIAKKTTIVTPEWSDYTIDHFVRLYSFKHGNVSSSVKQVRDIPRKISASPVFPHKNEVVKIDLSSLQSPKSLIVVNTAGQTVLSQSISNGQKEVNIETGHLATGMYIVRVADANNEYDNCRIIIR